MWLKPDHPVDGEDLKAVGIRGLAYQQRSDAGLHLQADLTVVAVQLGDFFLRIYMPVAADHTGVSQIDGIFVNGTIFFKLSTGCFLLHSLTSIRVTLYHFFRMMSMNLKYLI